MDLWLYGYGGEIPLVHSWDVMGFLKVQIQTNPDMGPFTMKHHETISLQLLSHLLRLSLEFVFGV